LWCATFDPKTFVLAVSDVGHNYERSHRQNRRQQAFLTSQTTSLTAQANKEIIHNAARLDLRQVKKAASVNGLSSVPRRGCSSAYLRHKAVPNMRHQATVAALVQSLFLQETVDIA
jgi:hypothetical protein